MSIALGPDSSLVQHQTLVKSLSLLCISTLYPLGPRYESIHYNALNNLLKVVNLYTFVQF